jgi:hypothetical protein
MASASFATRASAAHRQPEAGETLEAAQQPENGR